MLASFFYYRRIRLSRKASFKKMPSALVCGRKYMNNFDDFIQYLESFINFERSDKDLVRGYKLERMNRLLDLLDHPEKDLQILHIAGSKGKGSVGIMAARILQAAGYKTGLYSSPHIASYKERISEAGDEIADELWLAAAEKIKVKIEQEQFSPDDAPTVFELLTALAFQIFKDNNFRWAVIETGLGGRLDATNVIDPVASLITSIELEHVEILGDTLAKIAGEKAGIIKPERPVFVSELKEELYPVFQDKAAENSSPCFLLKDYFESYSLLPDPEVSLLSIGERNGRMFNAPISMPALVQGKNAALVYMCLRELTQRQLLAIPSEAFKQGFQRAVLPGRMEVFNNRIVLDGAHTRESISQLITSLKQLFPQKKSPLVLFGSVEGKNSKAMAEELKEYFQAAIISTPGSFKKSNPEAVTKNFLEVKLPAKLIPEPKEALKTCLESPADLILVCGSFYMVAEIRPLLMEKS
jgi:dihydrofolate synthase/folylpolyglutamate synthase